MVVRAASVAMIRTHLARINRDEFRFVRDDTLTVGKQAPALRSELFPLPPAPKISRTKSIRGDLDERFPMFKSTGKVTEVCKFSLLEDQLTIEVEIPSTQEESKATSTGRFLAAP